MASDTIIFILTLAILFLFHYLQMHDSPLPPKIEASQ